MTLSDGQRVTLHGSTYQISAYLGHGAIAETYLATLEDAPEPLVIRLLKDDIGRDSREAQGMQREASVLEKLNQLEDAEWPPAAAGPQVRQRRARETIGTRFIIALLDSGHDDRGRPFVVQEHAPAAFQPFPIETLADERHILQVAELVVRVIELCHAHDLTLQDFAPRGEKLNRIRVAWDADAAEQPITSLKIIDWNVTGGPEYKAQDLFFFGGHLYYFLFQAHVPLYDGLPPSDLSLGNPRWEQITAGSRFLLQRLLQRDQRRRYQMVRELRADLSWWIEMLGLANLDELERRAWQVAPRPEQQLAVADLALRLARHPDEQQRFERIAEQARNELEKASRLLLDPGIVNLRTGLYRKAVEEFNRILSNDSNLQRELAAQARSYRNQASVALALREAGAGDLASDPGWREVNEAAEHQRRGQARQALELLDPLIRRYAATPAAGPLNRLSYPARANMTSATLDQHLQSIPFPRDLAALQGYRHDPALVSPVAATLEELRKLAEELAPDEPEIRELHQVQRQRFTQLQQALEHYDRAAECYRRAEIQDQQAAHEQHEAERLDRYKAAEAELDRAVSELAQNNAANSGFVVAEELLRQAQQRLQPIRARRQDLEARLDAAAQSRSILEEIPRLLEAGEYALATERSGRARTLAPAMRKAQLYDELAQLAYLAMEQAKDELKLACTQIENGALVTARATLQGLLKKDGQQLVISDELMQALPPDFSPVFILSNKQTVHQLVGLADQIKEVNARVAELSERHEYGLIGEELARLQQHLAEHQLALNVRQQNDLRQARDHENRLTRAGDHLRAVQQDPITARHTFKEWLHTVLELIGDHGSVAAAQVREEVARFCLQLIEQEPDLQRAAIMADLVVAALPGTPLSDRLSRDGDLLKQGQALTSDLQPHLEAFVPAFLAQDDWPAWLKSISDMLFDLRAEQPRLQSIGTMYAAWMRQALRLVSVCIDRTYAEATILAAQMHFEQALLTTRATWEGVPELLREQVTYSAYDKLPNLIQALDQRIKADRVCRHVIAMLIDDQMSFPEAASRVQQIVLPQHHAVQGGDLQELQRLLRQAAAYAKDIGAPLPLTAGSIYDLWRHAAEIDGIGRSLAHLFPDQGAEQPAATLKANVTTFADRLARRLCKSLKDYGELPGREPGMLVSLHRYVRWLELASTEMGQTELAGTARDALNTVGAALNTFADQERRRFERCSSARDLENVRRNLAMLHRLNADLAGRPPTDEIPLNVMLNDETPALDPAALHIWEQGVEAILAYDQPSRPADAPFEQAAGRLDAIEHSLAGLKQLLERLKEHVWPTLFAAAWSPETSIAQLEQKIDALRRLRELLAKINLDRVRVRVIDGLTEISIYEGQSQIQASQPALGSHWLVAPEHHWLTGFLEWQRQEFFAQLGQLTSTIFEERFLGIVARLQHDLFGPVTARQVAEHIREAVQSCVDQGVDALGKSQTDDSVARGVAAIHWSAVALASQKWAAAAPASATASVGSVWGDLHRYAIEQRAQNAARAFGSFSGRKRFAWMYWPGIVALGALLLAIGLGLGWLAATYSQANATAVGIMLLVAGVGLGWLSASSRTNPNESAQAVQSQLRTIIERQERELKLVQSMFEPTPATPATTDSAPQATTNATEKVVAR